MTSRPAQLPLATLARLALVSVALTALYAVAAATASADAVLQADRAGAQPVGSGGERAVGAPAGGGSGAPPTGLGGEHAAGPPEGEGLAAVPAGRRPAAVPPSKSHSSRSVAREAQEPVASGPVGPLAAVSPDPTASESAAGVPSRRPDRAAAEPQSVGAERPSDRTPAAGVPSRLSPVDREVDFAATPGAPAAAGSSPGAATRGTPDAATTAASAPRSGLPRPALTGRVAAEGQRPPAVRVPGFTSGRSRRTTPVARVPAELPVARRVGGRPRWRLSASPRGRPAPAAVAPRERAPAGRRPFRADAERVEQLAPPVRSERPSWRATVGPSQRPSAGTPAIGGPALPAATPIEPASAADPEPSSVAPVPAWRPADVPQTLAEPPAHRGASSPPRPAVDDAGTQLAYVTEGLRRLLYEPRDRGPSRRAGARLRSLPEAATGFPIAALARPAEGVAPPLSGTAGPDRDGARRAPPRAEKPRAGGSQERWQHTVHASSSALAAAAGASSFGIGLFALVALVGLVRPRLLRRLVGESAPPRSTRYVPPPDRPG